LAIQEDGTGVEPAFVKSSGVAERPSNERPSFMAEDTEDERIPLDLARSSAKAIRQAGADLTCNAYETGHRINRQGIRDLSVWWHEAFD
jgi:predicted esterase